MKEARTISISIARNPREVYDYLADPTHLPEWSVFITAIHRDGAQWVATTAAGDVRITFTPYNAFGILDHDVAVSPQTIVHVPMRVVGNEGGSEVLFTILRQSGMSESEFERDMEMVRTDLRNLKSLLERTGH